MSQRDRALARWRRLHDLAIDQAQTPEGQQAHQRAMELQLHYGFVDDDLLEGTWVTNPHFDTDLVRYLTTLGQLIGVKVIPTSYKTQVRLVGALAAMLAEQVRPTLGVIASRWRRALPKMMARLQKDPSSIEQDPVWASLEMGLTTHLTLLCLDMDTSSAPSPSPAPPSSSSTSPPPTDPTPVPTALAPPPEVPVLDLDAYREIHLAYEIGCEVPFDLAPLIEIAHRQRGNQAPD